MIIEFLDDTDRNLALYMPPPLEVVALQEIMTELQEFERTTKILQVPERTLSEARTVFDALLSRYPEMERHISSDGAIVHSREFENGIVKVLEEEWEDLTMTEKLLLHPFEVQNMPDGIQAISPMKLTTLATAALKTKKRKLLLSPYIDLGHIPPTSNIVERIFSTARLILTDYRKSMSPYTFECVMFLKFNREYWDCCSVSKLVAKLRATDYAIEI